MLLGQGGGKGGRHEEAVTLLSRAVSLATRNGDYHVKYGEVLLAAGRNSEAMLRFDKILKLKPSAPPRWVIAAGAAVGDMWGRYVAEFRAAPYPKDWDQPGDSPFGEPNNPNAPPLRWSEIRAQSPASLDRPAEKQRQIAKGAFIQGRGYAGK